MDPLDSHSIARFNAERTLTQLQQREGEWLMRLNPHLSNDQLHSWTDVAEELLAQGFEGYYSQTQRLARTLRVAFLDSRSRPHSRAGFLVLGPRLQALRDTSQPLAPAPAPPIHALVSARNFQLSAAQQSQEHAEEPQTTAEEPQSTAEESHQHAQQSPGHVEEPQATVEEPRQQAEQSHEHAEEPQTEVQHSQQDVQQFQEHTEELQTKEVGHS
ncbi:hypothetical protein KCU83_g1389, partial [Aureobasidium melanogenum]